MFGYITVTPPKGHCFTIYRGASVEDITVCKKENVRFTLNEATREGWLSWTIFIDDNMEETQADWLSPVRIAYIVDSIKPADSAPEHRFISGCIANTDNSGRRRIELQLLNGPKWLIRLPKKDVPLPQPPNRPNLVVNIQGRASITKSDVASKDDTAGGENKAPPKRSVAEKTFDFKADRKEWHIPMEDGYKMNSSNFMGGGDVTPGMKGKCRYRFSGTKADPNVGRIECKGTSMFKFVYAPLTCINDLGGPRL